MANWLKIPAFVSLISAFIGGCATPYSEAPRATNFVTSEQKKVQAGSHWIAIADDLAKTISTQSVGSQSIYINPLPSARATAFNQALHGQLLTALVSKKMDIVKQSSAALIAVDIDTQVVKFSANRPHYHYAGVATALTAGLWALSRVDVLHPAPFTASEQLGIAIPVVAGVDALSWFQSKFATDATPQYEIFVTVTISDKDRYLSRTSNVYYIADSDHTLYTPRTINVTGDR